MHNQNEVKKCSFPIFLFYSFILQILYIVVVKGHDLDTSCKGSKIHISIDNF